MAETTTKKHKGSQAKKWKRTAKGGSAKTCTVDGCKRAYRAKGYCYFHYKQWRQGELGHNRYTPCITEKCTKRPFKLRLCEQHYNEKYGKKEGAAA